MAVKTLSLLHVATIILAGFVSSASPTFADDHTWGPAPATTLWDNFLNWSGGTVFTYPSGTDDTAYIDWNGDDVELNIDVEIGGLTVEAGLAALNLDTHTLTVNSGDHSGTTTVSGILRTQGGILDTDVLTIESGGIVVVGIGSSGRVQVDETANVRHGGRLSGQGSLEITGTNDLINNGKINASIDTLTITPLGGSAEFDWDGDDSGQAEIGASSGGKLIIDIPINNGGADAFNGTIDIGRDGEVQVNSGWVLGDLSGNQGQAILNLDGAAGCCIVGTAKVTGGAFTVNESNTEINVVSATGIIASDMTMNAGTVNIAVGADLQIDGTSTLGSAVLMVFEGGESEFIVNETATVDGLIQSPIGLTKSGSGVLILNGANTYTGGTTISAGRLQVNTNSLPSGTVANNSELEFNQTSNGSYSGVISGVGELIKSGSGLLTLSSLNSYAGDTTIDGGRIIVSTLADAGQPSGIGAGSMVEINGPGTSLQYTGPSVEIDRDFVVNDSGFIYSTSGTLTLAGTIEGGGSVNFAGSGGAIAPTGTNTYTGGTIIQTQSTTIVDSIANSGVAGPLGAGSTISISPGATLQFTGASGATNRTISLFGGPSLDRTIDVVSGELTLTSSILGGHSNTNLVKDGDGTLVLTGTNSYSDNTVVAAGRLTVNTFSLPGNVTNNSELEFNQPVDGTRTAVISGTGDLYKTGAGMLTLDGPNAYSGDIVVQQGTLRVLDEGPGGARLPDASTVTVSSGATLRYDISTADAIFGLNGAGNVDLIDTNLVLGNQAGVGVNGGIGTFSGIMSGDATGRLEKKGSGTFTFAGTGTYGGFTKVHNGEFVLAGSITGTSQVDVTDGPLAGAGLLTINGGTLTTSGDTTIDTGATLNLMAGQLTTQMLTTTGNFNMTGGRLVADTVAGNLTNAGGTVAPGDSPGTTVVAGDYDQLAGATLEIEIGGLTEFDRLEVTGFATLEGTLDVMLIDGFVPEVGDNFGFLMASGGFDSSFSALNLPELSAQGLDWELNPGGATLFLEVVSALAGDFDGDGDVDGNDFLTWQRDPNVGDLNDWQSNFGNSSSLAASLTVPEPDAFLLMALASICGLFFVQRR